MAVADFLSISCGPSTPSALYSTGPGHNILNWYLVTNCDEDEGERGDGVADPDHGDPPLRVVAHEQQEAHGASVEERPALPGPHRARAQN